MCADCVRGVTEDSLLPMDRVFSNTGPGGEGSLLGVLSNSQYVSSAGSSGSLSLKVAELLDHDRSEHPEIHPGQPALSLMLY